MACGYCQWNELYPWHSEYCGWQRSGIVWIFRRLYTCGEQIVLLLPNCLITEFKRLITWYFIRSHCAHHCWMQSNLDSMTLLSCWLPPERMSTLRIQLVLFLIYFIIFVFPLIFLNSIYELRMVIHHCIGLLVFVRTQTV